VGSEKPKPTREYLNGGMPPVQRRHRLRGAARDRMEAEEAWLKDIPKFQGFAPTPPGGWASVEDLVLASIPQEALALDRKRFNIWKRSNHVSLDADKQRALTKIR
jgi:hypothetical protein